MSKQVSKQVRGLQVEQAQVRGPQVSKQVERAQVRGPQVSKLR